MLIAPKLVFGMPFTDLTARLSHPLIPERLGRALTKALIRVIQGPMERLGFRPLKGRSHALSNATIVQHIAYRRRGEARHRSIEGKAIGFSDGSEKSSIRLSRRPAMYRYALLVAGHRAGPRNVVELYSPIVLPDGRVSISWGS